ncbi:MAG: hypothetical protein PHC46_01505 [Clostridia bacterium]|nr:hypothetical protein [Clostridia bacterium]
MNGGEVRIAYTLKQGDSFLKVAQCFETTVDKILSENKHLKPNKSNVGEVITVAPGSIHNFKTSILEITFSEKQLELNKKMRFRWQEHIFWTRETIIAILEDLKDKALIVFRLLENPIGIAELFSPYYSKEIVQEIEKLIKEHLTIASNLLNALKEDDSVLFDSYHADLYKNADDIVNTLASINPNYNVEELSEMFYQHLDLLIRSMVERKNNNYAQQIKNFDASHEQIVLMADMLADGIVKQFPDMF